MSGGSFRGADQPTRVLADDFVRRIADATGPDVDPDDARRDLGDVIRAADGADHIAEASQARYALARVLVLVGEADQALDLIDEAARGWSSIGAESEALRTNLGRMHVLDDLGRHEEAVSVGRSVAVALSEMQDRDAAADHVWLRAAIEENTGVALGYLGRHAGALAAYASAVACYERLDAPADVARVSLNRGVELCELARSTEAIDVLSGALAVFVRTGDRLNEALCRTNLAEAWVASGRYLEAFECLDAAASALRGLDHTTDWLRAELARADCLVTLDLDVEALDLYDGLLEPFAVAGLRRDLAKSHLGRGIVLARSGITTEARVAFDSARTLFAEIGDRTMLARTSLASVSVESEPLDTIEVAIELLSDGERPAEYALALLAAARHLGAIDPDRASEFLLQAEPVIGALQVPELTWQLHHLAGKAARRRGDRESARAELDLAVRALDQIRATISTDRSRQRFDGARRIAADDMIDLLLDGGEVDRAFRLSDSLLGRGLEEAMDARSWLDHDTTQSELRATYDRLLSARGPVVDELTARARRLERQVSRRRTTGRPGTPSFAAGGGPISAPPDGTVCFQIIDHEVVAFVGADGSTDAIRKVCEVTRVDHLLKQLVAQWRRFEHPQVIARHIDLVHRATVDVLRELHLCLVDPIADHVPTAGGWTVVADGAVGAVPFAALHDGDGFLVERLAIRQTPSLGVDRRLRELRRRHGSVLAIGVDDDVAPMAPIEARRVGEAWAASGGTSAVLADEDATAAALLGAAAEYDVIHVAGHGLFRDDAPEFSAVRLADRWVTAAELSRLDLDGQLVVLSACDTGRRHTSGPLREVAGLPRALLAAGARGVIACRWPADDLAVTRLMSALHHGLARGDADAEALRRAQLATQATHPHPYHWASAMLVGGSD